MSSRRTRATTSSYYDRNCDERKSYQKFYYEAKKGLRKVSKAARRATMGKRKREQRGERSAYRSPLAHTDPVDDPCRDVETELALSDDVVMLRDTLSEELGEDGWVPQYTRTLQHWIDKYIKEAQDMIAEGVGARAARLHHLRRFVAGLRQEQDLAELGRDARRAVVEDLSLILWGRRINTVTFFRLYPDM
ncbi:hypothetical protein FA95DRAFT_1613388 [Auriscalpium vulgare]|uniref:Uncharacterized protein n=1 Tax=Auriscalpium vulgare TaxID=40419 RepID=A0ACB8R382_9AGAM|nr:hypothetical protein FA95DRAFT_1613388 [Auriscalpium vulgare]